MPPQRLSFEKEIGEFKKTIQTAQRTSATISSEKNFEEAFQFAYRAYRVPEVAHEFRLPPR